MKKLTLLFLFSCSLFGQNWAGILDTSRAIDWSTAGVVGGIPDRATQCGSTIAAYTGTAATINAAIAACPSGQHVQLGAGTFNLSTGITWNVGGTAPISGVTLRGAGPNSTFLVFSGGDFCNGYGAFICMAGSNSGPNGENNVCNWTSGYAQGATTITLANCGSTTPASGSISNLKVGSLVILDQVDEATDTGTIWNCLAGTVCAQEGSGSFARTDGPSVGGITARSQNQVVKVTQCDGNSTIGHACSSGTNITISPGLYMPNWTSSQSPQAWYATTFINTNGIEDVSVDNTSHSSALVEHNFTFMNCDSCWMSRVVSQYAGRSHLIASQTQHCQVSDSYFYQDTGHNTQSYGIEHVNNSDCLVQNNIFQQVTDSTPTCNGGCEGDVAAYNFAIFTEYASANWFQSSYYIHASGNAFMLWEGNIGTGFTADDIHGTSHFSTVFRNHLPGWQLKCNLGADSCTAQTNAVDIYAGSRYFNFVGNILGTPGYHTQYDCLALSTSNCGVNAPVSIYSVGYTWNGSTNQNINGYCTTPSCSAHDIYDPQAVNYMMRWGNYDVVNAANRFVSGEVPSGVSPYGNAVPSNNNLPNSFYLSAKPSWFGSHAWPGIGPDVTGGDIGQCSGGTYALMPTDASGKCTGGSKISAWNSEVNMNPAMDCYLNTMSGPVDGSGSILAFDPATCYAAAPPASVGTGSYGPRRTAGPRRRI